MATLEITPALVGMAVGWFASTIAATWTLSQRSKKWDEVDDTILTLFGDRKTKQKGLVREFEEVQAEVAVLRARVHGMLKGMRVYGSSELEIVHAVRRQLGQPIEDKSGDGDVEGTARVRRTRSELLADAEARFELREASSEPFAEDDPFPNPDIPTKPSRPRRR